MTGKMRDYVKGLILGLSGKPLPFSKVQKVPVAYLFNGVRLPALPETDYPYAIIVYFKQDGVPFYRLFVSESEPTTTSANGRFETCDVYEYWGEAWELTSESVNSGALFYANMTWSNVDVIYNGAVKFSASDPVPVYE